MVRHTYLAQVQQSAQGFWSLKSFEELDHWNQQCYNTIYRLQRETFALGCMKIHQAACVIIIKNAFLQKIHGTQVHDMFFEVMNAERRMPSPPT